MIFLSEVVFAYTIELLYTPVLPCTDEDLGVIETVPTDACAAYLDTTVNDMKDLAANIAYGSFAMIIACLIGNILLYWGFGNAVERLSRRIRQDAFHSLCRQECGFFDAHPVGALTSQLQDDAAFVHAFAGEPIRSLLVSLASVLVGLVVGFYYMWPFALLFIGILPFLGFVSSSPHVDQLPILL